MNYISAEELKERLDQNQDTLLLDIREAYELEICQIGGLHIPMGDLANRIDEVDTNAYVVILCRSGRRAEPVANMLMSDFNCKNVSVLKGGILNWIETIDNTLESY